LIKNVIFYTFFLLISSLAHHRIRAVFDGQTVNLKPVFTEKETGRTDKQKSGFAKMTNPDFQNIGKLSKQHRQSAKLHQG
jgi:hypothetical protein